MRRSERRPATLPALIEWLGAAPPSTLISAGELYDTLTALAEVPFPASASGSTQPEADAPWSARLWTVPTETRLGVTEAAEALGRPRSWVYRHTGPAAGSERIPHRKLDGSLVFVAGELRAWLRDHEEVIAAGPSDRSPLPFPPRRTA